MHSMIPPLAQQKQEVDGDQEGGQLAVPIPVLDDERSWKFSQEHVTDKG